ncbi:MAG: tetratricopeptide repeat protein [Magnetococcales bacterium]|nr:tetratricopeptide repeat protein [Magnetococcales bacterium]MBF0157467.1 tetratricopeptide repeat protein [Magnetococcales bacterium]
MPPTPAALQLAKGEAYLARDNPQMALMALQAADALEPDNPRTLAALGRVYDLQGRLPQALSVLERAALLAPDNSDIAHNLGVALLKMERLDEAEAAFRRVLADPRFATSPDVHFNLALLYQRRNDTARMVAALKKTLELVPNHGPAHMMLAVRAREEGRFEEEQSHLKAILAANPTPVEEAVVLERLVESFMQSGQSSRARALLRRLIEILPPGSEEGRRAAERLSRLGGEAP